MRRTWVWVVAAVVAVVLVAGGGVLWVKHSGRQHSAAAQAAVTSYAQALSAGRLDRAAYDGQTPAAAQKTYLATVAGMGGAQATVRPEAAQRDGSDATSTLHVTWTLPGGARWSYDLPLRLVDSGGTWKVAQGQHLVHPDVAAGGRLRVRRTAPPRAEIQAADGSPLVSEQDVVDVGIQRSRITGPVPALTAKVAGIVGVDGAALTKQVSAASPSAFVDVITLRMSDYQRVKPTLQPLPGVVLRQRKQALAPTKEFARALLGSVGQVTGDIVKQGKGRYVAGDFAGVSGLQRQYDTQLAGTAGVVVEAVPASGTAKQVFSTDAKPGTPLKVTLSRRVQQVADASLSAVTVPSSLVAVDVKTGQVLAVSNSPAAGLDQAVLGHYQPGSTFKVVSTLALLRKGLMPTDPVNCPPTATVEGRTFKNYESEKFGAVPFSIDFAKSCNTAFVGLSSRLADSDLHDTAAALGIGGQWNLGTPAFSGSVPVNQSAVDKAAATFGQGRNLVSPLAVAVASASVARGSYLSPTLVLGSGSTATASPDAGQALPSGPVATLRTLMRQVVTSGTGTALANVPGGPVYAKTGTAEFGSGKPLKTHAWITGWQGSVAFAVFVEEGKSGGTVAGPVAAKFLTGLANS